MWVFGNSLYRYVCWKFPFVIPILGYFMHQRILFSLVFLTLLFMIIYKWIPNRTSSFRGQFPGALIATLGWVAVSVGCSIYMDNFTNFSYIYGSMAGIMILLLWLYFCMSMVFYGAEVNYFLENKDNYHLLIRTLRPNWRRQQRAQTEKMRQKSKSERADRKNNKNNNKNDHSDIDIKRLAIANHFFIFTQKMPHLFSNSTFLFYHFQPRKTTF